MNENHDEDKPRMNADKRRCGLDVFSFPGSEVLSADTLGKASDLTPLHTICEIHNQNTNIIAPDESVLARKEGEMLVNSRGLTPLRFDCEIYHNNIETDSTDKGFSVQCDTLKKSSRLAPLRPFDKFAKRGDLDER